LKTLSTSKESQDLPTLVSGDSIHSYIKDKLVGIGVVISTVDGRMVGDGVFEDGHIVVEISDIFLDCQSLNFLILHEGCPTLKKGIGCLVKWKWANLQKVSSVNNIELNGTEMELQPEDFVQILAGGKSVGKGKIFSTNPVQNCHSVPIGLGNISLSIHEVYSGFEEVSLMFSHPGAKTLDEAKGSIVKWSKVDIDKIKVTACADQAEYGFANVAGTSLGTTGNVGEEVYSKYIPDSQIEMYSKSIPDSEAEMPSADFSAEEFGEPDAETFNYRERRSWYLKEVVIFAHDKVKILGTATITVYHADFLVNEQRLGDDHVGVVFTSLVCCFDSEIRQKELPLYYPSSPFLVRWPLLLLKQVGVVDFLGELVTKAYEEAQAEEVSPT
jgi:hypothetical protein